MCESAKERLCLVKSRMLKQRIRYTFIQPKEARVLDFRCVLNDLAAQ